MTGKVILLAGYSGAGKSTLERAAIENIASLQCLKNTTTRAERAEGSNGWDYEFVNQNEYSRRRRASPNWNHIEYAGYSYGIDIDAMHRLLAAGTHIIGSVIPDLTLINRLRHSFTTPTYLIWLGTPLEVANVRIAQDGHDRQKRINEHSQTLKQAEAVKSASDYVFPPRQEINEDTEAFLKLVNKILSQST